MPSLAGKAVKRDGRSTAQPYQACMCVAASSVFQEGDLKVPSGRMLLTRSGPTGTGIGKYNIAGVSTLHRLEGAVLYRV